MYVKVKDGQIEKFPFYMDDLLKANPTVSFPQNMSDDQLSEWGVEKVRELSKPNYSRRTEKLKVDDRPQFVDGEWQLGWSIVKKSDEDIEAYDRGQANFIDTERKNQLAATDWMALQDSPKMSDEWKEYRQALRDITKQDEYPFNVTWPKKPTTV